MKRSNVDHTVILDAIRDFFIKNPVIEKDNELFPNEEGLYQAHTIANYIADSTSIKRDDVLFTIKQTEAVRSIMVRNKKIKISKEIHNKLTYYYGGDITIDRAKQIKEKYERESKEIISKIK